ncbi:MAG TPA: SDR family oxidoreductase [Pseudonocardiaceae bacterium]|nr:SDR family oxidoreductase [Pseudonocardiaceae bacterium]
MTAQPSDRPLALVTGASRGIGRATARLLAATHDVLLGGRDVDALTALAAQLPGARSCPVDVTDYPALAESVAGIERLDVLVHSAGVVTVAPLADIPAAEWHRVLDVNVVAVAELTRLLLPALRAARGRVVLVNSGSGLHGRPEWGLYAASKFALRAYADVLRDEEAAHGVRVTSVFPGRTDTDMQREVWALESDGDYRPERYLRVETVAEAIRYAVQAPPDAQVVDLAFRPGP